MLSNSAICYEGWETNRKDTEKAKDLFREAKDRGRIIEDENGNLVDHWRQIAGKGYLRIREVELNDTSVKMQFICEDGDKWVNWDSNVKEEVLEAAKKFNEYVSKGWLAYAVDPNTSKKGRRLLEFNAEEEEILFGEGPRMKLQDFVKSFRKVKVAAKTYPG